MFGFLIILSIIFLIHSILTIQTQEYFIKKKVFIGNFFLLSYFIIQLNFELVSHNFGLKFFYFFNNNFFFLLIFFIISINFYYKYKLFMIGYVEIIFSYLNFFSYNTNQKTLINNFKIFIFSLFILWPILSYLPLINYFYWTFFNVSFFNQIYNLTVTNLIIAFILFYTFMFLKSENLFFLGIIIICTLN